MKEIETKILVIGGGVTGLCAAHYLANYYRPQNVVLLEASKQVGGKIGANREHGFVSEWAANGFLDKEPKTIQWIKDLGLYDKRITANEAAKRRFIYKDDQLLEVKPPPALFKSKLLSLGGRARLMQEPLIPTKKDDTPETVYDLAVRRVGQEAADMLAVPMVSGVFGADAKTLSAAHAFPKLVAMEKEHGSLFKGVRAMQAAGGLGGTLTSFPDGIGTLLYSAAAKIMDCIQFEKQVIEIRHHQNEPFQVFTQDGTKYIAEAVVLATPAHAATEMFQKLERGISAALASIKYHSMAVVCAGFRRDRVGHDLDGFGFLVPRNQAKRGLGVLWSSSIYDGRAPDGYVLMRAMYGGATDPQAISLTDQQIVGQFVNEFREVMQLQAMPEYVRIFRHQRAIPSYGLEHGRHLKALEYAETTFKGLVFAGSAYRGVGINDCVADAHRAYRMITERVPQ